MLKFLIVSLLLAVIVLGGWALGPRLLVSSGDMREPRSEVYASRLGSKIYTAGGIGFYRTLSSCAVFDTAQREWGDCPDMPRSLHHVAMAAGESRVFASGGYAGLPFSIDRDAAIFALAPGDSEWSELARLPQPLGQHTMSYHGGALYFVGGERDGATLDKLLRFNLASGEWTSLLPMSAARHSHAVAQDDGALYVTGGRSPAFGSQSASVEKHDFATGKWSKLPDMPEPLAGHGSAVIAGKLHVYGGENLSEGIVHMRHDVLDLATGVWRAGAPLSEARHGFANAEVDGTIWVLGGGRRYGLWTPLSVSGTALPLSSD